jgi:hypothetical protein
MTWSGFLVAVGLQLDMMLWMAIEESSSERECPEDQLSVRRDQC